MAFVTLALELTIPCRCGFCLLHKKDHSSKLLPSSPDAAVKILASGDEFRPSSQPMSLLTSPIVSPHELEQVIYLDESQSSGEAPEDLAQNPDSLVHIEVSQELSSKTSSIEGIEDEEEEREDVYYDCAASQTSSLTTIWEEEYDSKVGEELESGNCSTYLDPSAMLLQDDFPPTYVHTQLENVLSQSQLEITSHPSPLPHPNDAECQNTAPSRILPQLVNMFGIDPEQVFPEPDDQSLVDAHTSSSGSLVFDHLKHLLFKLDIPDQIPSKGWAYEGPYSKPKPSSAFDGIPFEFIMPSLNEMRKRIERLESERLSPTPLQKPIILRTFRSIPAWGKMPCVKASVRLDTTIASPCLVL